MTRALRMSRLSAFMTLLIYILYFLHELNRRPLHDDTALYSELDIESHHGASMETDPLISNQLPGPRALPPRTIRFADEDTGSFERAGR